MKKILFMFALLSASFVAEAASNCYQLTPARPVGGGEVVNYVCVPMTTQNCGADQTLTACQKLRLERLQKLQKSVK